VNYINYYYYYNYYNNPFLNSKLFVITVDADYHYIHVNCTFQPNVNVDISILKVTMHVVKSQILLNQLPHMLYC